MKTNYFNVITRMYIYSLVFFLFSCSADKYDIFNKEIDMTVSIGGDSLAIPLGSTGKIFLSTYLDDLGSDMIYKVKLGNDSILAIRMKDEISFALPVIDKSKVIINDFTHNSATDISMPSIPTVSLGGSPVLPSMPSIVINEDMSITQFIPIPDIIKEVDSLIFELFPIIINLSLEDFPDLGVNSKALLNLAIKIPDKFILNEKLTNNTLNISQDMLKGNILKTLYVRGIKFEEGGLAGNLSLNESISIRGGIVITLATPLPGSTPVTAKFKISIGINDIVPTDIYGIVEPVIESADITYGLEGLPELLTGEGVVLDFSQPIILAKMESNIGIPINAEVELLPYDNEIPRQEAIQNFSLELTPSKDPTEIAISKFWISNSETFRDPAYADYEFKEINLPSLFVPIPTSLDIKMNPIVDITERHHISMGVDYSAKFTPDIILPFIFGEDFKVSLADTITDINSLTDGLDLAAITLKGEIENSIPLDLKLSFVALNSEGDEIISDESIAPIIINSAKKDGTATSTSLNIPFSDLVGSDEPIYSLILSFEINAGDGLVGARITGGEYISTKLSIKTDGGITITDTEKTK